MSPINKLVEVQTQYGPIRGCRKESVLGRDYFNFQRIPYMAPPVGKLRFRDPQAPEKWQEPLDCTQEGSPFCNFDMMFDKAFQGELDAMFINVYTNNIKPTKPYPVMVWIHGGGIFTGNALTKTYGPDYFMQKDVVLVTFQYRIGVFGFLSLDDPELNIPGNAQFRDHIFALKWIRENISKFGGDPGNVTLFGESWGGGSTSYHMTSEKSKGLFHRGILMSGTALNSVYSIVPRRKWAERLCVKLGYTGPTDDKHLLEFLEDADPKDLVMNSLQLLTSSEMAEENLIAPFGPTIEPYDNGNAFIYDEIPKMMKNCWGNSIDILISGTSNECLMIMGMAKVEAEFKKMSNFLRYVPIELGLETHESKREEFAKLLKKNYYGMLQPSKTNLEGVMHVMNDNAIWHPMTRVVRSREASGQGGKSYVYRFDIDSDNNHMKAMFKIDENYRDVCHGEDIHYVFKSTIGPTPAVESPGFKGILLMLSIFTEFAATGNPNVEGLGEGVKWEPATLAEPLRGINIDEKKCELLVLPEAERCKIFDDFFVACNKDLY